jgi:hypothetical protein
MLTTPNERTTGGTISTGNKFSIASFLSVGGLYKYILLPLRTC